MAIRQPLWLSVSEMPPLPKGWTALSTEEAFVQLKPGPLYDASTVKSVGSVPVIPQSQSGFHGYHDDEPGVQASELAPVVTFANHTCAMRLIRYPFSCIQNIFPKVGRPGVTDTRYLYYACEGRVNTDSYKGHHPIFRKAHIPIPPLPTQHRIASILSAYDDLIENCERRIRVLDEMARALYREWFVLFRYPGHEKTPMVDSPMGRIPKGWSVRTVGQFGDVVTGKTPSKANPTFSGDYVPFIKTPDMHGNHFILTTGERLSEAGAMSQRNKTIPPGSLCVSCIGTIGVVSIVTEASQTNQQINSIVPLDAFSREFLFFRLQDAKQELTNLGTSGATMGNVNKGKFEALRIVTPTSKLLEEYHIRVAPLFDLLLDVMRQVENLRKTRDLLLPRLLSGQLPVEGLP